MAQFPSEAYAFFQNKFAKKNNTVAEQADCKRKTMVHTYSAALNSLDNSSALLLLEKDLDDYSEFTRKNNVFDDEMSALLSKVKMKRAPQQSGLNTEKFRKALQPMPCGSNGDYYCSQSENINNEDFQQFLSMVNRKSEPKQNTTVNSNDWKVRSVSKNFGPRSCHNDKKFTIPQRARNYENNDAQNPTYSNNRNSNSTTNINNTNVTPETYVQPVMDERETKINSSFKTAREELKVQNFRKYGSSGSLGGNSGNRGENFGNTGYSRNLEDNSGNCGGNSGNFVGGQKRKLGPFGGTRRKFVSPLLTNIDNDEVLQKSQEDVEPIDERLRNIDPKMVELIRSEIMDCGPGVDWNDIAGLEFAKTAIQEAVVWPMLRPDIFTGLRRPPKGILLFGPPGTGKTLIGKCVASQSQSTFFSISASSLTSKWIGDGEKMVRALFAVARVHQPSVIFIDEIDSLLSQRNETEHESSRRIKTEFLVQLDGATTENEERLLVIGATNRPQELDEAARRRFVKRLYIPLPELEARLQLIQRLMSSERNSLTEENVLEISQLSDGYSGADMRNLCSEASLGPIRSIDMSRMQSIQAAEVRPVEMQDFKKAFTRVRSSVSPKDLDQYVVWDNTYGSGVSL